MLSRIRWFAEREFRLYRLTACAIFAGGPGVSGVRARFSLYLFVAPPRVEDNRQAAA
jgi:hypothetical protein